MLGILFDVVPIDIIIIIVTGTVGINVLSQSLLYPLDRKEPSVLLRTMLAEWMHLIYAKHVGRFILYIHAAI